LLAQSDVSLIRNLLCFNCQFFATENIGGAKELLVLTKRVGLPLHLSGVNWLDFCNSICSHDKVDNGNFKSHLHSETFHVGINFHSFSSIFLPSEVVITNK